MAGRRSKRLRATKPIRLGFLGANARFTGDLVDISRTGLLLRCLQNVEPGTVGRLGIPVGNEMIRIVVAVRRRVPSIGLAFEFTGMSAHDRELLQRLLVRL